MKCDKIRYFIISLIFDIFNKNFIEGISIALKD